MLLTLISTGTKKANSDLLRYVFVQTCTEWPPGTSRQVLFRVLGMRS